MIPNNNGKEDGLKQSKEVLQKLKWNQLVNFIGASIEVSWALTVSSISKRQPNKEQACE